MAGEGVAGALGALMKMTQGESGSYVVRGAKTDCSRGSLTSRLNLPVCHGVYLKEKAQLTINDYQPFSNILPFGICQRPGFPDCTPKVTTPWQNGKSNVLIEGQPALLSVSCNACTFGGKITIHDDGQEG